MKKKYYLTWILIISFIGISSCFKKSKNQNESSDSALSSLTLKTHDEIKKNSTSVKIIASSTKEGCSISYPQGSSLNEEDISDGSLLSDSNSTISLSFFNKCFPYKITVLYSCKDDSKKICFKGSADADLNNKDPDTGKIHLALKVKSLKESDKTDVDVDVSLDEGKSESESRSGSGSSSGSSSSSDSGSNSDSNTSSFPEGITHIKINATVVE